MCMMEAEIAPRLLFQILFSLLYICYVGFVLYFYMFVTRSHLSFTRYLYFALR